MMKQILSAIIVALGVFIISLPAPMARAQLGDVCVVEPDSALCKEHNATGGDPKSRFYGPDGLLTRIAQAISLATAVAAVIMIIIGAFRFITSSGDPSNLDSARNMIIWALIGLCVAASAQLLVVFVLNRV